MREHADLLTSVRGDITESKVRVAVASHQSFGLRMPLLCVVYPCQSDHWKFPSSLGYRRHVAEGTFATGEGIDSWQHQPGMVPVVELDNNYAPI